MIGCGSHNLISSQSRAVIEQMEQTMKFHNKCQAENERKYYHTVVSFDIADLPENGGKLTNQLAYEFAHKFVIRNWPKNETFWVLQQHSAGQPKHLHIVTSAIELESGKKLHINNSTYRKWKDQANNLAAEMGLSALDWKKAVADKRKNEISAKETFAEKGLKSRGKSTWKDELRTIIDNALKESKSEDEFKTFLKAQNVVLTRFSDKTISYRFGDRKACRGDTLGSEYTVQAIRKTLKQNHLKKEIKRDIEINENISSNEIEQPNNKYCYSEWKNSKTNKPYRSNLFDENGRRRTLLELVFILAITVLTKEKGLWTANEIPADRRNEPIFAKTDWKIQNMIDSMYVAQEEGIETPRDIEIKLQQAGEEYGKAKKEFEKIKNAPETKAELAMAAEHFELAKKRYAKLKKLQEDMLLAQNQQYCYGPAYGEKEKAGLTQQIAKAEISNQELLNHKKIKTKEDLGK